MCLPTPGTYQIPVEIEAKYAAIIAPIAAQSIWKTRAYDALARRSAPPCKSRHQPDSSVVNVSGTVVFCYNKQLIITIPN